MRLIPNIAATILMGYFFCSCQTVGDQAPPEARSARKALDDSKAKDVHHIMPSAYEAARRKLNRSVDLLEAAAKYQEAGDEAQASQSRDLALKEARASQGISEGAMKIMQDVRAFDKNSWAYLTAAERATKFDELQAENTKLKTENRLLNDQSAAQLKIKSQYDQAAGVGKIPDNFRVAKVVAFFSAGKSRLDAKFRPDIQELANLLKENSSFEVKLEGFADPRGSDDLNNRLAQRRIDSVRQELVAQGVDPERVKAHVFGKVSESAKGISPEALQLDRKVTATVYVIGH